MNDNFYKPELGIELATLVLQGSKESSEWIEQLGAYYDPSFGAPSTWSSKVLKLGIVAGASMELIRWLMLTEFDERGLDYRREFWIKHIEDVYAHYKPEFDRDGYLY